MPKLLLFSDVHLHNFPAFSATDPDTGLNTRLLDQLRVLAQIRDYCRKDDIEAVIFCGDLFHSRTKIDVDVLWAANWAMREIAEVTELYLLVGNHDQSAKDGSIHSLDGLVNMLGMVVSKPCKFSVANGNVSVVAHPFTADTEAFIEYCKTVPKCDLFIAHQGVSEAKVGAYELPLLADIPLSALPHDRASFVLLGHYHKHQWLNANTAYVGSPLQLDFGERVETKGFLVVDTDAKTTKFVESNAPKFFLYETPDDFKAALGRKVFNPEKDFVRVHGYGAALRKLQDAYPRIQTVAEAPVKHAGPRIEAAMTATDSELLTKYVERATTDLDKKKLLELGLKLLVEE